MASFVFDTNLSLGLSSIAKPLGNSSEKDHEEEANRHLLLDLNLAPEEQPGKNNLSDECDMNHENNNINGLRKKLRLSNEQSFVLEECFKQNSVLNFEEKNRLASELDLMPRQVEVWFQNRRARTKLKLTETDCKHWKKNYEEMAEENERLKQELKMANFRASKRPKLDGSSSFPVPMNANGDYFCPNCHHNLSTIKNYMSNIGDINRPAILKPTPKYGGVKIPRI